jgi:phenylacetate-CoA ligase
MVTLLRKLKLNCKNCCFTARERRIFIESKKKRIVAFHLINNPFYQQLVGTKSINNWTDLPVLTKKNLQQPLAVRLSTDSLQ